MLNKLWNCGVGIKDERGEVDHVSSTCWSQSENASAFLQVLLHELGADGCLPSDPSHSPAGCVSFVAFPKGAALWVTFCTQNLEWRYIKHLVKNATQEAPSFLVLWLLRQLTLKPLPCGLWAFWTVWLLGALTFSLTLLFYCLHSVFPSPLKITPHRHHQPQRFLHASLRLSKPALKISFPWFP